MRERKTPLSICYLIFLISLPVFSQAADNFKQFSGGFSLGYRFLSKTGSEAKYREDINLDEGVRLFNFNLDYVPEQDSRKLFDRIELELQNYGGDPFEIFLLRLQKLKTYSFQFERKKAAYFYQDLHQVNGQLFDSHPLDFERRSDSGMLRVDLNKNIDFYLNFERFTKKGKSSTTFDIQRVEFEFEKPIEEDSKEVRAGIEIQTKNYTFILEEKILGYKNEGRLFLPGVADGGQGARYPSSLNFFTLNEPYELKSYSHLIRINAIPLSIFRISGSATLSNLDMDLDYSEDADGIDYLGRFFSYSLSGKGSFKRSINLYDLDLSFLISDKLTLFAGFRHHDFNQEGRLRVKDEELLPAEIDFFILGGETGLQYHLSSKIGLMFGYRHEVRTFEAPQESLASSQRVTSPFETITYEERSTKKGIFGNFRIEPISRLVINLDYENGFLDEPFTLISPTSFSRFRVSFRTRFEKINLLGSYLWKGSESEVFLNLWQSRRNQLSLQASYRSKAILVSGGYSLIDQRHEGKRNIAYPPSFSGPGGTFLWEILYEGRSNLLDSSLLLNLTERLKIGASGNLYWNLGFWEISRNLIKAYLEYLFPNGISASAGYRYLKFKERLSGFNDYGANILEISFSYRWE